jgi:hypothetical protein
VAGGAKCRGSAAATPGCHLALDSPATRACVRQMHCVKCSKAGQDSRQAGWLAGSHLHHGCATLRRAYLHIQRAHGEDERAPVCGPPPSTTRRIALPAELQQVSPHLLLLEVAARDAILDTDGQGQPTQSSAARFSTHSRQPDLSHVSQVTTMPVKLACAAGALHVAVRSYTSVCLERNTNVRSLVRRLST